MKARNCRALLLVHLRHQKWCQPFAYRCCWSQKLLLASGAQQSSEPESSVAAQGEAAAMAEPQQRQGTRVSQKKVDQVKVDPLLCFLHVACA